MDETQLVPYLEAVYALQSNDQDWLNRVLVTLGAARGDKYHYLGFFYDASDVEDFKLWNVCAHSMPFELVSSFERFRELTNADFVRCTFRSLHVGSARRTAFKHMEPVPTDRARIGWGDPSGLGCVRARHFGRDRACADGARSEPLRCAYAQGAARSRSAERFANGCGERFLSWVFVNTFTSTRKQEPTTRRKFERVSRHARSI